MPESKRKISQCKECDAEIIWITHLGKKHAVDAEAKRGFVFIEDEYGEDIGAIEMASIHEPHSATCPNADELSENEDDSTEDEAEKGDGVEPLNEADIRTETLSMPDGSELIIDKDMRANSSKIYREACEKAVSRSFKGEAVLYCETDKCHENKDGFCMADDDKRECQFRTGGGE